MKKIVAVALCLMLVFTTLLSATAFADSQKTVIKLSLMENEEHPQGLLAAAFEKELEALSDGQIDVQVFYNGSLYSLEAAMPAMRSGDLEATEFIMRNSFWVGVYPGMTDEIIDYMAKVIIEAIMV